MFKNVLIPLDGSPLAERILAYLPTFVSPKESQITLLRVLDVHQYYAFTTAPEIAMPPNLIDLYFQEAESYLQAIKNQLRQEGYQVHAHVASGEIAATICNVAENQAVDLVAMTTHGRSGFSRWMLGSVADRVVRKAKQPVWLVRPETELPASGKIRRILLPLDGSSLAEQALPYAHMLAQKNRAEIHLLRSVQTITYVADDMAYVDMAYHQELQKQSKENAKSYLQEIQTRLEATDISSQVHVFSYSPASAIIQTGENENIDLIVMSTHGRGGISRWVFGSVADKVLHSTPHPLLLIRATKQ